MGDSKLRSTHPTTRATFKAHRIATLLWRGLAASARGRSATTLGTDFGSWGTGDGVVLWPTVTPVRVLTSSHRLWWELGGRLHAGDRRVAWLPCLQVAYKSECLAFSSGGGRQEDGQECLIALWAPLAPTKRDNLEPCQLDASQRNLRRMRLPAGRPSFCL